MSVIAFKQFADRIEVAADGICLMNDEICSNNFKKIIQITDELIIGVTGLANTTSIFEEFARANRVVFEKIKTRNEYLRFGKRIKDYLIENYGYSEETFEDAGGFFIANKYYHGMMYFDDHLSPYIVGEESNAEAFGTTRTYTTALLDIGFSLEDAIKKSAEKYNSINGNVTLLTINYTNETRT